jgi:hypothetical protein
MIALIVPGPFRRGGTVPSIEEPMGIAELTRLMNARPQPDPLHRLLGSLLTILEQPAEQDRPLVNATYSVWYLADDNLCRHLLENLAASPLTPSEQSQIEVLLATRHWIDGQIPKMHQLLQKQIRFLSSQPGAREISFIQSLGRHLVHLLNTFIPARYQVPSGTKRRRIDFIGDSHVLAPANLIQPLGQDLYQVHSHYVQGVKLWHVIQEPPTKYRIGMENTVSATPDAFAVFSVGEIDCRPNAGFYNAIRRDEYPLTAIPALVERYLDRLEVWRGRGLARIGIWGIPAPREDVLDQAGADKALVRDIVATVSDTLKQGSKTRGLVYFDLHALTQRDGFAVGGHHIDHAHVGSHVLGALAKERLIHGL